MTRIGILLLVLLSLPALAYADIVCDVRQEVLAVVLALNRFTSTTSKAVLQELPRADAVRAGLDFENQKTRAYYVCPIQLRREGSPEAQIMELVFRQAHASQMMLIQGVTAIDVPTVKEGTEAGLKLIDVAARDFGLKK